MSKKPTMPTGWDKSQIMFSTVFGSHMRGMDTEDSDTDIKGVYVPTMEQYICGEGDIIVDLGTSDSSTKNTKDDVDEKYIPIQRFVNGLISGDVNYIDMLHSPIDKWIYHTSAWTDLAFSSSSFYRKDVGPLLEYIGGQANKYGLDGSRGATLKKMIDYVEMVNAKLVVFKVDRVAADIVNIAMSDDVYVTDDGEMLFLYGKQFPLKLKLGVFLKALRGMYGKYKDRIHAAETNENIDWKQLSHALRAGYQQRAIFKTGGYQYPLAETEFLMKVKAGEADCKTVVLPALNQIISEVRELAKSSNLPDAPDADYWKDWVVDVVYDPNRQSVSAFTCC